MLTIKFLRDHKDLAIGNAVYRNVPGSVEAIEKALQIDAKMRPLQVEIDALRNKRNLLSESINKAKKEGKDVAPIVAEAKLLPQLIAQKEEIYNALEAELQTHLIQIPNLVHKSVPQGESDKDNVASQVIGKPKQPDFDVAFHGQAAEKLGLADFDSAAKMSGKGFFFLKGDLALLNQALIQFSINALAKKGYTYVEPPLMIKRSVLEGVYSKIDIEQQSYKVEGEDLYLIATSEHPLIGMFAGQTVDNKQLPIKLAGYSQCFRREVGSHGLDERGLFRTHQFNKVEQVVICRPEDSDKMYDELLENSLSLFRQLELPVRVLDICTGDLGLMKHKQQDIEAYSPRKKGYIEVCSCSNLTDNQSALLGIRSRDANGTFYPHTLNNTAIATSRVLVAILENYQQKDGSIVIPKVLRPYFDGREKLNPL